MPPPRRSSYASALQAFNPGPWTRAVKWLICACAGVYVLELIGFRGLIEQYLGLVPGLVIDRFYVWQPVTYLFVHAGFFHILFNMFVLWMFGVELERLWGTRFFLKFYFICGIGAAAATLLISVLPFSFAVPIYYSDTIGASGALYGLLVAYALYFPEQPVYMYFLFPIKMKYFVLIIGAIAFFSSFSTAGGGIANVAHLGGLLVGYLYLSYLKGGGFHPLGELKYRYLKWKMNRLRRKFDVYSGGQPKDWDRH
ncbi:MAG TPA: rhomboid family intramembrane serine protease [Vicinamibacterales bacterium]|jgi:membrane associated rhomboid family serine protease